MQVTYVLFSSVCFNILFSATDTRNMSEPDPYELWKSREKVTQWLKTQHTTSGYEKEKENEHGKRRPVLQPRKCRQWSPAGGMAVKKKKSF